jgi:hypothetical protein
MRLLEFTADDLARNRAGQLSPHQLADATRAAIGTGSTFVMALGLALMLGFGLRPLRLAYLFYMVMSLAALTIVGAFAATHVAARVDPRVVMVQGPINLMGGRRSWGLVVGRQHFLIPEQGGRALRRGDEYRVYSLAHSSTFLSLEPLAAPEADHAH